MSTINVVPGSVVLLVDGHGCHRLHLVDEWDVVTTDAFRLGGDVWRSLEFNADVDATIAYGLPVTAVRAARHRSAEFAVLPPVLAGGLALAAQTVAVVIRGCAGGDTAHRDH